VSAARPRGLRTAFIAAVAAVTVALTGCASHEVNGAPEAETAAPRVPLTSLPILDDPHSYVGESTATLTDASIVPVLQDPAQSLPATVTSHDTDGEHQVTVADTSRVIAIDISGTIAATVWGLGFGDSLVGRDQSTTFPEAAHLPLVTGGGHAVNAEAIIALAPSLIITDSTVGPRDVIEQLRDVGITVVTLDRDPSLHGAAQLARDVAAVYGAPEAGELLADHIDADIDTTLDEIAEIAPEQGLRTLFLYLRGGSGIYYLLGESSGASDLIKGLGAIDLAEELGWGEAHPLTDEAIVAADPELILVMTNGLESVGGVDGLLASKPVFGLTAAGKNRRFVDMSDGQVLSFGPRTAEVLDALARAIYAPDAS